MRSKSNVLLYNITAVVIGLVISGLLLLFMKVNPLDVCGQALGKIITDQYNLGEILVKATPLIFTSLAFAFTYNANLFNIGAQGQFAMGAIIAVALSLGLQDSLPTWLLLLLVLLGSFAGGAAVGGLIGGAKAKFHANEFLVSMMSTYVITNFMDYLLRTSLQETKAEYMQTDAISSSAYLPNIIPGTRVHLGFLIAVAAAVAAWILLNKTQLGFQIRAVGKNADASRLGGISSGKIYVISFMIAGGLAGMAGLTEINGVQHMLLRDFNASIGSYGIGIAIAAVVLFLWQGGIYLGASYLTEFISDPFMTELSIVGGFLIAASGISILKIKDFKTMNLLPSLLVPVIFFLGKSLIG